MKVYLSGEIHTDWREQIIQAARGLAITFTGPVTDHGASAASVVAILGAAPAKIWPAHQGATRTRHEISTADVVVVRFGEKYRQWNAAFDAGYAAALGKSLIIVHGPEHQHALKEVDAAAAAVTDDPAKVADLLRYVLAGVLPA